jgi:hypothetical protein
VKNRTVKIKVMKMHKYIIYMRGRYAVYKVSKIWNYLHILARFYTLRMQNQIKLTPHPYCIYIIVIN